MNDDPFLPSGEPIPPPMPSPQAQSWGVVASIIIIVLMIIVGAFYAWGQRISQGNVPAAPSSAQ